MVISLRKWLLRLKYALIFMLLSYMFYYAIGLMKEYVLQPDKYRVPEGSAVKVFYGDAAEVSDADNLADRLKLFYWYGE